MNTAKGLLVGALVMCCALSAHAADIFRVDAASTATTPQAIPQATAAVEQFMQGASVFIENQGQWSAPDIHFALNSQGANVGLTDQGPKFQLFRKAEGTTPPDASVPSGPADSGKTLKNPPAPMDMHAFGLVFDGAAKVVPAGRGKAESTFNYTVGAPENRRENVPSFNAAWYEDLYPGVSLEVTGRRTGIKYNFHVAPGADWKTIRLRYENIQGLALRPDGALEVRVKDGWEPLSDGAPCIYQEVNSVRKNVAGAFRLIDDHSYGFDITGSYDNTLPLVIDPAVEWGTYQGDMYSDYGQCIAVDNNGNVYAAGYCQTAWAYSDTDYDAYVVKLTRTGARLWTTYLGGINYEVAKGIAVDGGGNAYVTGYTNSTGWVRGGWNTTLQGTDAFVVKLSPAGTHLWSTYLGGAGSSDYGLGIAADESGNVYATGQTDSAGWISGGWNSTLQGTDGYLVKLSTDGAPLWYTYLGGARTDVGYGIAVDSGGNVYAAGSTDSSGWVAGGWDTTLNDGIYTISDGFVVKLSPSGAHLWSTYVGGKESDVSRAIAVDDSDNVLVTGHTYAPNWVSGGWDTTFSGTIDAYVAKLSAAGAHLWSSYLGGTGLDWGYGVAVDGGGNVYATGETTSSGWVAGGWDTSQNGGNDAYVVRLSAAGAHVWSSYLGGTGADCGYGVAADHDGRVYVTGNTKSSGWVSGGWDTTYAGVDAFVVKVFEPGETGDVQVTLTPPEAVAAGAQWRRVGTVPWLNSGDLETGVVADFHEIEFKDVAGWVSPAHFIISVAPDGTVQRTAEYTFGPPSGGLRVTLTPAAAVAAGAQWRRAGTATWLGSGDSESGLPAGACTIEFKSVPGWVSPASRAVTVPSNGTSLVENAAYTATIAYMNWSTYLGGAAGEWGRGVAVDGGGNVYATGSTSSGGWVAGGGNTAYSGGGDVYVVKLSPAGAHLWSTYLGGTAADAAYGIAVDGGGNAYVTGYSTSPGWVSGGWNTTLSGDGTSSDAFVAKLSASGAHLWSTYLGGANYDWGYAVAVDGSGNVYATGYSASPDWVSGGWRTTHGGGHDAYVVKLGAAGDHLWSTYLGGAGTEYGYAIAADDSGNACVTGTTSSSGWVSGGWDTSRNGDSDAFVAKLGAAGGHLWSTYLGGSDSDGGYGIAVDGGGNMCVTGGTRSSGWVSGGWDSTQNGGGDAFVAKLSASGAHLWSTFLGGARDEGGRAIALDGNANLYVTGTTNSPGWVSGGGDTTYNNTANNGRDAFAARLSAAGAHQWSTYLGGQFDEWGEGIAVDSAGNAYVTGETDSSGWVSGGWNIAYGGGGNDAFLAKLVKGPVPEAPTHPGATAIAADTITWTWEYGFGDEPGFNVWAAPGALTPFTLVATTAAGVTAYQHDGLSANTQYTFQVSALNDAGEGAKSEVFTTWTLARVPAAPAVGGAVENSLTVAVGAGDGNPAGTQYALHCGTTGQWVQANGALGASAAWQTAAAWGAKRLTDLTSNTMYSFAVLARNGAGVTTAAGPEAAAQTSDATLPTGTVSINAGAARTFVPAVTLTLSADDGAGLGVVQMQFSNNNVDWSAWVAYAASKAWTLESAADGVKTVYVRYRDGAGNISAVTISDSITLDMLANIMRVDASSTAAIPDGRSWATAYRTIGAGISAAGSASGIVWVKQGTYTSGTSQVVSMNNCAKVYGGFAGTETALEQRDWAAHPSIIDGQGARCCVDFTTSSTLDGFTITRGKPGVNVVYDYYVNPFPDSYAYQTVVRNCKFTNSGGAAIWAYNLADQGVTMGQFLYFYNCQFTDNPGTVSIDARAYSHRYGSGMGWNNASAELSASFSRCVFSGASVFVRATGASDWTYATATSHASASFSHCTLYSSSLVSSCNDYTTAGTGHIAASASLSDSIVWGGSQLLGDGTCNPTATNSCIQGGYAGAGNISDDPLFVAAPDNLHLQGASPCIRPGTDDDMGAYEYAGYRVLGGILINNNAKSTTTPEVTLSLNWSSLSGSPVTRMRFSDDGATWSPWEPVAATRAYTLPGPDGYHTVRVQFRDAAGNVSARLNDYILLDGTPPTGTITINNGAASTKNPEVTLSLTWADGTGSGVSRMRFSDNGSTWTAWESLNATKTHTLPLPPGGYQTVRVQYRDSAGNYSSRFNDYIRLDVP